MTTRHALIVNMFMVSVLSVLSSSFGGLLLLLCFCNSKKSLYFCIFAVKTYIILDSIHVCTSETLYRLYVWTVTWKYLLKWRNMTLKLDCPCNQTWLPYRIRGRCRRAGFDLCSWDAQVNVRVIESVNTEVSSPNSVIFQMATSSK